MHRRIAILFIASALIVMVHSDVLKCYMCTSLSKDCESNMVGKSVQPVECTWDKMFQWQKNIGQHKILSSIAHLFEVDETFQHYPSPPSMACAKMILDVRNTNVTVRTCQTAKTEILDPCEVMKRKLKEDLLGTMKQCTLCKEDACNSTASLSPEIFYILSFLGILLHVIVNHRSFIAFCPKRDKTLS
ncbi:hypothetical protein HN011_009100 [Eciton burchellii]|nr:hypothetical protein HN011_009100 [Eciton burchellii]